MYINGKTKVFAILGNPVGHSLSPLMHTKALDVLNYNGIYVPFQVEKHKLKEAVAGIRALGVLGGNITVPYKESIIPYLDRITEEAEQIGAVNTYYWQDGELWGTNTDGQGFTNSLVQKKKDVFHSKGAVILGAGGAARAICISMLKNGIKDIIIVNRNQAKASALANHLQALGGKVNVYSWEKANEKNALKEHDLIINTTSIGMEPQEDKIPPIDTAQIKAWHFVVDIIYKPQTTLLLQTAKEKGCVTMNGMGMLLEQGVLAFKCFTGLEAPVEVMRKELERWF